MTVKSFVTKAPGVELIKCFGNNFHILSGKLDHSIVNEISSQYPGMI
jgi:hypothetical protein